MSQALADAVDRLYAAPLEDFVALRKSLAAELKSAGDVAGSSEVLALKKPSRTAWALNQLARRQPEALRAAVEAHSAATKAQSRADAEAMRETARAFRDRLGDITRQCEQILAQVGAHLDAAQARRLGETVRAAIGGDRILREQLFSGRLSDDIAVENPFGSDEASGTRGGAVRSDKQRGHAAAKAREREQEAQKAQAARARAMEEAQRQVKILEEEARQARATARQAETNASRAQAAADRARVALAEVEKRLDSARKLLSAASLK
jgi:hypothetical protein